MSFFFSFFFSKVSLSLSSPPLSLYVCVGTLRQSALSLFRTSKETPLPPPNNQIPFTYRTWMTLLQTKPSQAKPSIRRYSYSYYLLNLPPWLSERVSERGSERGRSYLTLLSIYLLWFFFFFSFFSLIFQKKKYKKKKKDHCSVLLLKKRKEKKRKEKKEKPRSYEVQIGSHSFIHWTTVQHEVRYVWSPDYRLLKYI